MQTDQKSVSNKAHYIIQALARKSQPIVCILPEVYKVLRGCRGKPEPEDIAEIHESRDAQEYEENEADCEVW